MKNLELYLKRTDGKIFNLNNESWGVLDISGIDYPENTVYTTKLAVGDGSIVTGTSISGRTISISSCSKNKNSSTQDRNQALSFFSPKYSYKLYITYEDKKRYIECELSGFSCINGQNNNMYSCVNLVIQLYACNPFWRSVDDFGKDIASVIPAFAFPYIECLEPNIPAIASVYNFSEWVEIYNYGDVPTELKVIILATGRVVNPKIFKGDKFVRVLDTLQSGDKLILDFSKRTLTKNEQNIIQKIDRSSNFTSMELTVGQNVIRYGADDGSNNMSVTIYYNQLYLGV